MSGRGRLIIWASIILFLASLMACGGGSPAKKIIGKWQGDLELFKNDPEYKKMEDNPFAKILLEMIGNMKMEITADTFIVDIEMMGKKKTEATKYKIISETKHSVTIEAVEGEVKGKKSIFTIIDSKHIKLNEEGEQKKPGFIFKKM